MRWTEELEFDTLGRIAQILDGVGAHNFTFVGNGNRIDQVAKPFGVVSNYDYYPLSATGTKALRLSGITNTRSGTVLSSFGYNYATTGDITEWSRNLGGITSTWKLGYNAASEIRKAVLEDGASQALDQLAWGYDLAGNRLFEQEDASETMTATFNSANQMVTRGGAGRVSVEGEINEPGQVWVDGEAAQMRAVAGTTAWSFHQELPVAAGSNQVAVRSRDETGNEKTENYQFTVNASQAQLTYDANGNLTSDGAGRTFTWDAKNRLTGVTVSGNTYAWTYDGLDRRQEERVNGTLSRRWIWDDLRIIEERNASNVQTVAYYENGEVQGGTTPLTYTTDHLGSVREMVDSSGAVRARYDYAIWGKRVKLSGDLDTETSFTGHIVHAPSGLLLAPYRVYGLELGRWLSRDPFGLVTSQISAKSFGTDAAAFYEVGIFDPELLPEGPNIYGYVDNNPVNFIDPSGEIKWIPIVIYVCGRLFIDWVTDGDLDGNRKRRPEPERTTQSQKAKSDSTPKPSPSPLP